MDMVVLVLDPIRLLDTEPLTFVIRQLSHLTPLHLVVNGALPPNVTEADLTARIHQQLLDPIQDPDRPQRTVQPHISIVRTDQALYALHALSAGLAVAHSPTSRERLDAFDVFQRQFLDSNVGLLREGLVGSAAMESNPAFATAELAMSHIGETITADRVLITNASGIVHQLRDAAKRAATKAKHLSVAARGIEGGLVEEGVEYDMLQMKRALEDNFIGRWNWLSLIGNARIDDIGTELDAQVAQGFGIETEKQVGKSIIMSRSDAP